MICGHQRIKNLDPEWPIKGGFIKTPFGDFVYREVDWPEKKEKMANIAANSHGGEFDTPLLTNLLIEINDGSMDIDLIGFGEGEIKKLLGETPKDAAGLIPEKDPNIIVRISFHPGLWLGKREEIIRIFDRIEKVYDCKVKIDE